MSDDNHTMPATERDAFGHWLSGFVDGEGCFILDWVWVKTRSGRPEPRISFGITLRADDRDILREIRDFWGVGRLYNLRKDPPSRPVVTYRITRPGDLFRVVIPHFERHPLRAKKRRDFVIWRRGVELGYRVSRRPRAGRKKWTEGDRMEFLAIMKSLKEQRRYEADGEVVPAAEPSATRPLVQLEWLTDRM